VQFKSDEVSELFDGQIRTFYFEYRDPWTWIKELLMDVTLKDEIIWNSEQQYYCRSDGVRITYKTRFYDEANTGHGWSDVDVSVCILYCTGSCSKAAPS
jgi:hypothetical protein